MILSNTFFYDQQYVHILETAKISVKQNEKMTEDEYRKQLRDFTCKRKNKVQRYIR